jgi:hypothetical protein
LTGCLRARLDRRSLSICRNSYQQQRSVFICLFVIDLKEELA